MTECSGDNIFAIRGGKIYTPPVYVGILEGITRNAVMMLAARELGLEVIEQVFTVPELYRAEEVFVTGTGAEIIGVIEVNARRIADGKPGPVTRSLIQEFRRYARTPEAGALVYDKVAA